MSAAALSAAAREEMYTAFLQTEGYRPELKRNGYVLFTRKNETYVIVVQDDAARFDLRTAIIPLPDAASEATARRQIQVVMAGTKVAKLYIHDGKVWAAAQLLLDPPEGFTHVFGRCLAVLDHARKQFVAGMNPE